MANLMFHDKTAQQTSHVAAQLIEKSEHDKLVAEAYARGRSEAFAFLGLDEEDFPDGPGVTDWVL